MIYLTMVRVLANVRADTPEQAKRALEDALDAAGFDPYRDGAQRDDVTVSEVDEPDGIPAQYLR
jgi:hypothetical protein